MTSSGVSLGRCISSSVDDTSQRCASVVAAQTTRFCATHSDLVRRPYIRYKQLTQQMIVWHKCIMAKTSIDTLKKFYGLLAHVTTLRERFTHTWVHPSCQDKSHSRFHDKLSTMRASVEERLRASFMSTRVSSSTSVSNKQQQQRKKKKKQQQQKQKQLVARTDEAKTPTKPHNVDEMAQKQQQEEQQRQEHADVDAYLQQCIRENTSVYMERILEASRLYRRTFFQLWLWLERNKLLSGSLLQAHYQEQIDWAADMPFAYDMDTLKQHMTRALLVGGQLVSHQTDDDDDDQATLDPFGYMLCTKAILFFGEFAHPEQPTVARTVHRTMEGLLNWFYSIRCLRGDTSSSSSSSPAWIVPPGHFSVLWCMSSFMDDEKWLEEDLVDSSGAASVSRLMDMFIEFSDALDTEMQALDLSVATHVGGSPNDADGLPRILNMQAVRKIAIDAARNSKKSAIRTPAPADLVDVSRVTLASIHTPLTRQPGNE
jgi:hypothetical protein